MSLLVRVKRLSLRCCYMWRCGACVLTAAVCACVVQVGASWAGAPVGFVAQHYGWGAIRLLWGASILSSTVLLAVPGLLRQWELRKEREGLKVQ